MRWDITTCIGIFISVLTFLQFCWWLFHIHVFHIYGYSELELHPGSNAVSQTRTWSSIQGKKRCLLGPNRSWQVWVGFPCSSLNFFFWAIIFFFFFYKLILISVSLLFLCRFLRISINCWFYSFRWICWEEKSLLMMLCVHLWCQRG